MAGVLGMITGAGVYVAAYNWLEPVALALGDFGKVTVPELLGVPPWVVIVVLALVLAVVLGLLERSERRGVRRSSPRPEARGGASWWVWPGREHGPMAGGR